MWQQIAFPRMLFHEATAKTASASRRTCFLASNFSALNLAIPLAVAAVPSTVQAGQVDLAFSHEYRGLDF